MTDKLRKLELLASAVHVDPTRPIREYLRMFHRLVFEADAYTRDKNIAKAYSVYFAGQSGACYVHTIIHTLAQL